MLLARSSNRVAMARVRDLHRFTLIVGGLFLLALLTFVVVVTSSGISPRLDRAVPIFGLTLVVAGVIMGLTLPVLRRRLKVYIASGEILVIGDWVFQEYRELVDEMGWPPSRTELFEYQEAMNAASNAQKAALRLVHGSA